MRGIWHARRSSYSAAGVVQRRAGGWPGRAANAACEETDRDMSREQRRRSKTQPTAGGSAARRTPVKVSGGSGFPVMPVAIGGGAIIVVALLAYLILQSVSGGSNLSGPDKAEADSSSSIPGSFVPSQGRGHYTGSWTK